MKRMPAVSAANVSAIWPASAQTFRAFLCWSNTRRFWRYEAKKRRPVPPGLLQTCLWRPHLLCLAGKDGEKGAGVRFSAYCGCYSGSFLIYSCYERTNSPYGRYGTRRLLRYNKFVNSCVCITAINQLCVYTLERQYGFVETLWYAVIFKTCFPARHWCTLLSVCIHSKWFVRK